MKKRKINSRLSTASPLEKLTKVESSLLAINPGTSVTETLKGIAKVANDVLGGHFCVVQPYDQRSDQFLVEQFTAGGAKTAEGFKWTQPRPEGAARTALKEGMLTVENYDTEKRPFLAQRAGAIKGAFRDVADVRATLGIRLEVGGEPVGVLFINYPKQHKFTSEEKQVARFFAIQVANAIHNARVYERERSARELAETLEEVARLLTAPHDLPTVLKLILEQLSRVVPFDGALVGLVESGYLVTRAERGFSDEQAALAFTLDIRDDVIFNQMVRERRPIVIPEVADVPFWKRPPGAADFHAWVGVLLESEEKVIGQLGLYNKQPSFYSHNHAETIVAFAHQVAVAVRTARELESLFAITRDSTSAVADLDIVLKTVVEEIVNMIGTTRGAIVLYESGFGRVRAGYSKDPMGQIGINTEFPTHTPLQRKVLEEKKPVQVLDVSSDSLLTDYERKEFQEHGIQSQLIVPMIIGDRVIGSIGLDETERKRSFSSREVELCQIIAGQVAIAIENARLYERTLEAERAKLLSLVRDVNEWVLYKSGTVEELVQYALDTFLKAFPFQAGWVLVVEGQQLRIVATDIQHKEDQGRLLRIDASITGLAAKQKRSVRIDDLRTAEQYLRDLYQSVHGGGMRSELAVPMVTRDRCIGVFNLESTEPNAFTAYHQELVKVLTEHVAVAVESSRARQDSSTLSQIAVEVSTSLDLRKTTEYVLNQALARIGGRFGQILIREGDDLKVEWATGGEGIATRVKVNNSASGLVMLPDDPYRKDLVDKGSVVLSGHSVIIPDVDRVSRYQRVIEREKGRMRSELAVPIIVNDRVVGVFNVENPLVAGFSNEKEEALARFVSERATEIADALHRKDASQLKELMRQGLDMLQEKFGQLLALENMDLVIEHTKGDERVGTKVEIRRLDTGEWAPITGRAAMEKRVVNVPNVAKDPGYARFLGEEMKSELVVSLVARGQVIGVINLESPVPGYFNDEHARLLEPMASHAAIAIDNARTYVALDRARESEKLAAVGALSGDVVHRLRNPMGAIRARIELMRSKGAKLKEDSSYLEECLTDIDYNAERVLKMVQDLRTSASEPPMPVGITALVASAIARVQIPPSIKLIESYRSLPEARGGELLSEVFYNLLSNAVEAMPDGGILEAIGHVSEDGKWVDVSIKDTGHGIPRALLLEIFKPYYTTKGEAHGIGLWWSRAYVEKCGGLLEVASEEGKGSCFTVRLGVAT